MRKLINDVAEIINSLKTLNLIQEENIHTSLSRFSLEMEVYSSEDVILFLVDEFKALGKYSIKRKIPELGLASVYVTFDFPRDNQ